MSGTPGGKPSPFSLHLSGLTFQLFVLVFLPLTLLLLLITFGSIALHQRAMQAMVGERDERAVSAVAESLNDHVYSRLQAIHGLSLRAADVTAEELEALLSASDYLLSEFDGGLAFIDNDGNVLAARGDPSLWQDLVVGEDVLLNPIQLPGDLTALLSEPFSHPAQKDVQMVLAAAGPSGQEIRATGAFSVNALAQKILDGSFPVDNQINVFLVDTHRRLIFQYGALAVSEPVDGHPGVLEALRGESGTIYRTAEEIEKVVIFRPLPLTGWALVVEEPWETTTSPLLRTTVFAPLVLVPVLLLALVALGFATRQIVQPMQALADKTARLSWGEFETIKEPVGGIAEIRHLQAGLNHMAQKVQAAQRNLHSYIGAITAGQEEERRRLARELHDDTIQSLIALKQRVQLLQMDGNADPTHRSLIEIESLTEQTVDNLRRLTRDLRPIYLEDLGLVTALQMLSTEAGEKSAIPVQFKIKGVEKRLPPAIELALYRIAQEALNNVARHSQAASAALNVTFSSKGVSLEIIDDGKGFLVPRSPADFAMEGHYGLLGIHERAELIGAALSIRSSAQQGTHLSITLPVDNINLDREDISK